MRYFALSFDDLSIDRQNELIDEITAEVISALKKEAHDSRSFTPEMNWREFICDLYSIEGFDFENKMHYETAVRGFAEELAEQRLIKAFQGMELEVSNG